MTREDILLKGRTLALYELSEQADLKEEDPIDGLWYSLYDVCKLVHYGILEDVDEKDWQETVSFLKDIQSMTTSYQNFKFEF